MTGDTRIPTTGGRYDYGQGSDDDGDGYTECAGDCDDARAATHPGAAESCDGLDNDCDGNVDEGAGAPGVSRGLRLLPDKIGIAWEPQPGGSSYDVIAGSLDQLIQSHGNFASCVSACLENNGVDLLAQDPAFPAAAHGFFYLMRTVGCGSQSGTPTAARRPAVLGSGIQGSGAACPRGVAFAPRRSV